MIRALRQRHARIIGILAVVVPLLFLMALAARPNWPTQQVSGTAPSSGGWTAFGSEDSVRALIESKGVRDWLHLARDETLARPDVLVYWAEEAPAKDAPFPIDAVLLGPLGDTGTVTFDLPARSTAGTLLLYSLGHREIVAMQPISAVRHITHDP